MRLLDRLHIFHFTLSHNMFYINFRLCKTSQYY